MAQRDGVVQDGMYVEVTITHTYKGVVTDYEKGDFIRLDGHRVDLKPVIDGETSVMIVQGDAPAVVARAATREAAD